MTEYFIGFHLQSNCNFAMKLALTTVRPFFPKMFKM